MRKQRNAIPTTYNGVRFRSRLEARWAAFLDLLGLTWDYEPALGLDSYIPDFLVYMEQPLLVEVKPALSVEEMETMHDPSGMLVIQKIEWSGWTGEALVVGARLFENDHSFAPDVGLFKEVHDSPPDSHVFDWWRGSLVKCRKCRKFFFAAYDGSWHCRHCRHHAKHIWSSTSFHSYFCAGSTFDLKPFWHEAGNRVQWRKPA